MYILVSDTTTICISETMPVYDESSWKVGSTRYVDFDKTLVVTELTIPMDTLLVHLGVDSLDAVNFADADTVFAVKKLEKLADVQAEKVRARDAGFFVADTLFDSDISARTSYTELGLRLSQNPSFTTQWKASAGQWVTMDAALYAQVMTAGEAHITAVFAWQAAKEVEIGGCQTVEELEAVVTTY